MWLPAGVPPPPPGMSSSSAILLHPPPPPRTQRSLRCPPGTRRFLPWESRGSCVCAPHPEDDPNSSDAGARVCVLPGSDREGPGRQASRAFHARGTYGCHSRCPAARPSDSILPTDGHVPGTVADEQLLKGARRRPLGVDAHRRSTDKDEDTAQAFGGFWGGGHQVSRIGSRAELTVKRGAGEKSPTGCRRRKCLPLGCVERESKVGEGARIGRRKGRCTYELCCDHLCAVSRKARAGAG